MADRIKIKAYTIKELSLIYEVSDQTFRNWLMPFKEEIGERIGHFYTVRLVKVIFEKLGVPE